MKWNRIVLLLFVQLLATNVFSQTFNPDKDIVPLRRETLLLRPGKPAQAKVIADSLRIALPANSFVCVRFQFEKPGDLKNHLKAWVRKPNGNAAKADRSFDSGRVHSVILKTGDAADYYAGASSAKGARVAVTVLVLPKSYESFRWSWDTATKLSYLAGHAFFDFQLLPEKLYRKSPFDSTGRAYLVLNPTMTGREYFCDFHTFPDNEALNAAFSDGTTDRLLSRVFPGAAVSITPEAETSPGRLVRYGKGIGAEKLVRINTRSRKAYNNSSPVLECRIY